MKRLIALLLAAMISFSLGACGGTSQTTSGSAASSSGTGSTSAEPALTYPEQDIKFINPNSAGGGLDVLCRLIANDEPFPLK